jgi:hypothetical protein
MPITISNEVADEITMANLINARSNLRMQLEDHADGLLWMHEEDIRMHKKLIKYMSKLIEYYGGE